MNALLMICWPIDEKPIRDDNHLRFESLEDISITWDESSRPSVLALSHSGAAAQRLNRPFTIFPVSDANRNALDGTDTEIGRIRCGSDLIDTKGISLSEMNAL